MRLFKVFFKSLITLLLIFLFYCSNNPFFPKTGEPLTKNIGRTTPWGTIDQLFRAYETRNINLFMDLFSPAKDFRFYISPSFESDYLRTRSNVNRETIDTSLIYIKSRGITQAYYWTYDEEIKIHNNLFSSAIEIGYSVYPQPIDTNNIVYIHTQEGIKYAEVVVRSGMLLIRVKTEWDKTVIDYFVDIGEQVFYLERDPQNPSLWVITKWFDLGLTQ